MAHVLAMTPYERFIYWIKERHAIYLKKENGLPKPWSIDPLFQKTYYTNCYRELDKTTAWFCDNIRELLRDRPEVIFATICFRWFNRIETGEYLIKRRAGIKSGLGLVENWNLEQAKELLTLIKDNGHQVFTGAFNISNSGSTKPKIDRVCDDYIQPVWEKRLALTNEITGKSLAQAHKVLKTFPGLGGSGFMAAQVVADLKHTSILEDAVDRTWWSSPGPGSKRGLNRLREQPLTAPIKNWEDTIKTLVHDVNEELSKGSAKFEFIDGQDIQNCLCEFDKMNRVMFGEGQSKRRYAGC